MRVVYGQTRMTPVICLGAPSCCKTDGKRRVSLSRRHFASNEIDRAKVHRLIAFNYIGLGDTAKAEEHFKQAVALNPGIESLREDPRLDYGSFLFREGRLDDALPLLKQALEAMPIRSRSHRVRTCTVAPGTARVRCDLP